MAETSARAGIVGLGLGLLAAGAAVGAVAERRLLGRALTSAEGAPGGYGSVHSPPVVVTAPDGVQLYAEVDEPHAGAAYSGLTLVFCHGYALNLDVWHHQRLALSGAVRAVYWDQRGHGRSGRGPAGPVSIELLAGDLLAVIEATVPDGEVILVGHSMGGMTLMALADSHPELFGSTIVGVGLLATSAGRIGEVTLGVPAFVAKLAHRAAPGVVATLGRTPRLVEFGRRTGNDLEFLLTRVYSFASDVPAATVDFVARLNAGTPIDVVADFFGAFKSHDKFAALPVLRSVATLIMVGENDLLTPADHSRAIAAELPAAELHVLDHCGHMLLLEYPDEVNRRLRELLERCLAARS